MLVLTGYKGMTMKNYLSTLLVATIGLAAACNSERPAEDPAAPELNIPARDTTLVDTVTAVEEDGVAIDVPVNEPAPISRPPVQKEEPAKHPQQRPTPTQPKKAAEPVQETIVLQEGNYRLVNVQGESLPIVLDMTTECETKLLRGDLYLKGGNFTFQSQTAEDCGGRVSNQEKHEAQGSYSLDGKELFLKIRYGDVLGDARGVVEENSIRLQQIGNDEEQQTVDWLFRLQ